MVWIIVFLSLLVAIPLSVLFSRLVKPSNIRISSQVIQGFFLILIFVIGCLVFSVLFAGKENIPGFSFGQKILEGAGLSPFSWGIVFTIAQGLVILFACCFPSKMEKIIKFPTMIGMLGTLYSLIGSNLSNPQELANRFSIAIVSTFIGILVYLLLVLFMPMQKDAPKPENPQKQE